MFAIIAGRVALSAFGLVPRVGPARAIWIALRSSFAFKPIHESLRLPETKLLRTILADKDFGQSYLVITGEKGVGKSCLIKTVTSKTPGVIEVTARPVHSADTIIKNTLKRLARLPFDYVLPFESAKGVVFWHRLFTLGRSPIVVISAAERKVGQEYACLATAVRVLVENYKLRVIVKGSPNSLHESLLQTKRQRVVDIKPMTKEMIWQMGQLQELFKYTKEAGLEDTMFAVLGGIPADYEKLWSSAKIKLQAGGDARKVIGARLCDVVFAAINLVEESCGYDAAATAELVKLFQETSVFTESTLLHLERPSPDNVFREVKQDGVHVLIPARNAIGIVLKYSLRQEPSLPELEELIKPISRN